MTKQRRHLTDKQVKFVDGVLAGKTYVDAYLDAGYRDKDAGLDTYDVASRASAVAQGKAVSDAIRKGQRLASQKLNITKDGMLMRLIAIVDNLDNKTADRISACAQINKMLGFYEQPEAGGDTVQAISVVVQLPDNNRGNVGHVIDYKPLIFQDKTGEGDE